MLFVPENQAEHEIHLTGTGRNLPLATREIRNFYISGETDAQRSVQHLFYVYSALPDPG